MFLHSFRWQGFVVFLLIGSLLLLSWRLPLTQGLWDQIDRAVFFALNGSLAGGGAWAKFWAIMNMRYVDLISMSFMLSFLLVPGLVFERDEILRAICGLFALLIVFLIFHWLVLNIAKAYEWSGYSPSLRYSPSVLLNSLFMDMGTKDSSAHSFPGDHAAVLMFFTTFYFLHRINLWSVIVGAGAIFFMLPRLVAGAHSLSDNLVGGTLIMALTIAFGYFTPYVACTAQGLMRVAVPIAERVFWRQGWFLSWREQAAP